MSKKASAFAAVVCAAALYGTSAQAAVQVFNLGSLPENDTTFYNGRTSTGSFEVFQNFSTSVASTISASFSDTVTQPSFSIAGGVFQLFSCLTGCGTATPTGTQLQSVTIANTSPTSQNAGFGPTSLLAAGNYYLRIAGSTTAPRGVAYSGTVTLASAVPEPSTWAMMLLGFAGLAFAYGRSNQARTATV